MKIPTLVAVAATALLTLSACGNGSSSTAAQQPAGGTSAGGTTAHGLGIADTSLGKVLVDSRGMTLYTLSADGQDHSTCSSQCLQFWPAVAPAKAGRLSVTTGRTATPDGTAIATVAGHPVYTFSQDQQPGDVNGEGVDEFGGVWHAVSPTGGAVTDGTATGGTQPSGGSSSSTTGRGYAY
jgi:predicted lipoprotein with Yx(FWY)xxD motif